jgi:hypothetical protein
MLWNLEGARLGRLTLERINGSFPLALLSLPNLRNRPRADTFKTTLDRRAWGTRR